MAIDTSTSLTVLVHEGAGLSARLARLSAFTARQSPAPVSRDPRWLSVLEHALGHTPVALEAVEGESTRGILCLAHVRSLLFGRYLVGLPYLNSGGVMADDDHAAGLLIDRAVALADALDVRHLELRHERAIDHAALERKVTTKAHMRMVLPSSAEAAWAGLTSKVRSQVRKGRKRGLEVAWGRDELLPEFYAVFSRNMRDLGTPVYPRALFAETLRMFPAEAELCVVRAEGRAAAAALLLHGSGVTEVPSASSLKELNSTNANMVMYWNVIERATERGQSTFDFGRSTEGGAHYRFKKQWGAEAAPAEWQHHVRAGRVEDMRRESGKHDRMIRLWRRLPLRVANLIGPLVVRGIP